MESDIIYFAIGMAIGSFSLVAGMILGALYSARRRRLERREHETSKTHDSRNGSDQEVCKRNRAVVEILPRV